MATSIAAVADRAWLESIACQHDTDPSAPLEERVSRWADALAVAASRPIAGVLPAPVVARFVA